MRAIGVAGVIALAGSTGLPLAEPVRATESATTETYRRIDIRTLPGGPPPAANVIRRSLALGDPATWLSEADVPKAAWSKATDMTMVTLILEVSAQGQVTSCKPEPRRIFPQPAWTAKLCAPLTQRARVIPALTADGRRVADRLMVNVDFSISQYKNNESRPSIPVLLSVESSSPSTDSFLTYWPPRRDWLGSFARQPAFAQPVEPSGDAALTGPAIGLMVADPKSGDRDCRVVLSSDNMRLDDAACDFARTRLQPTWAETVPASVRRWPLLLSPEGKRFRAIQPDARTIRHQEIEPAEQERLRALWRPDAEGALRARLTGQLDPDGRLKGCRIHLSSGSDRADVAACRLLMTEARISPPRDIFGQPGSFTEWVSLEMVP